jgi:hypothetical protein
MSRGLPFAKPQDETSSHMGTTSEIIMRPVTRARATMGTLHDPSEAARLPPLLALLVISALSALSWAIVIMAVSTLW